MRKILRTLVGTCMGLFFMAVAVPSHAISIEYSLTALGGQNYSYVYTLINDGSLGAGVSVENFDIVFEETAYLESSLSVVTPAALQADWSETILASAPLVSPAYDAFALAGGIADGTSLSGFAVEFEWLLAGVTPGAQTFQIFDPISFDLLLEGVTRLAVEPPPAPVPEPGTLSLLLAACAGWLGLRRRFLVR